MFVRSHFVSLRCPETDPGVRTSAWRAQQEELSACGDSKNRVIGKMRTGSGGSDSPLPAAQPGGHPSSALGKRNKDRFLQMHQMPQATMQVSLD